MGYFDGRQGVEYMGEKLQHEVPSCGVTTENYILGKDACCNEVVEPVRRFAQSAGKDGVGKEI